MRFEKRDVEPLYVDYEKALNLGVIDADGVQVTMFSNSNTSYKYRVLNSTNFNALPFYWDRDLTLEARSSEIGENLGVLYKITPIIKSMDHEMNETMYFEYDQLINPIKTAYIDGRTKEVCPEDEYSTKVYLDVGLLHNSADAYTFGDWDSLVVPLSQNDTAAAGADDNIQILDLNDVGSIAIKDSFPEHDFFTGIGVTTTISYRLKNTIYNIENDRTDNGAYVSKQNWVSVVNRYLNNIAANGESTNPSAADVRAAYQAFISDLDIKLERWLKDNGRL